MKQMTYARGATINTGNFNSVRLDISATIELAADKDPESAYENLKFWVDRKLAEAASTTAKGKG